MNLVPVTDPADPRLDPFRHLRDAELLRTRDRFVAEGRLVVERVLAGGRYEVEALMLSRAAVDALRPTIEKNGADVPVFECPADAFESVTGFNIHRGCLAIVRRLPPLSWRSVLSSARLVVVLEAVSNADNVGGIFRNAAAFGVDAVLLSPTSCDPLYRKSIRTSMGHALRVPFARLEPWPSAIREMRNKGFTVAALTPRAPAITLDQFAVAHREEHVALLVGSEGTGLTDAAAAEADARVRIPMAPGVDSLNLAVATGIALSTLRRLEH